MNTTHPDGSTAVNEIIIFPRHESLNSKVFGFHSPLSNLLIPEHGKRSSFAVRGARFYTTGFSTRSSKWRFPEADPVTDSTRMASVNMAKHSQAGDEDWGAVTDESDV